MAEYGLRIKNVPNGFVQIDGTYANLALVERLTLQATQQGGGPNGIVFYTSRAFPGYQTPALAIVGNSTAVAVTGSFSGGVWTYTFYSTNNTPFEVYAFDVAERGQRFNINYGLVVKNKVTGKVMFDSRCKYMRVIDVIAGTASGNWFNRIQRNYPGKTKVGVCQGVFWSYSEAALIPGNPTDPDQLVIILASMMQASGNSIDLNYYQIYISGPAPVSTNPAANWFQAGYSYMVLDLSHYD